MTAQMKALLVILILGTTVFVFSKASVCSIASTTEDFTRRRNLWFAITLIAFLSNNFWIYIIITAMVLLLAVRRESNRLALFFFLLLVVPPIGKHIPGLGIIQYLFTIDYIRLLILTILLPSFLLLRKDSNSLPFGRSLPDKLLAAYLILILGLALSTTSITNTLRLVFYSFIDIFIPYYVASRSIKSLQDFRDVLMAFAVGALVMGVVGVFEASKHWLLYSAVSDSLGADTFVKHLKREGTQLRAQGSSGQAIVLGYVMAVALGFFFYLRRLIPSTPARTIWFIALVTGLLAPLSRGPWVGVAAMYLVFSATSPSPLVQLMKMGVMGATAFAVLLTIPMGEKLIALLPFVGTSSESAGTVFYREKLFEVGMQVVLQNPLFGSYNNFIEQGEDLRQGGGMIDVVNSYLGVALETGIVGLSIFLGFLITVNVGIFKEMRTQTDRSGELYNLGQALFSTHLGILVIIFTVSSIYVIPLIMWAVAGLGVAYVNLVSGVRRQQQL